MIPRLDSDAGLAPLYRAFLQALRSSRFDGDLQTDYAQRLVAGTDNSVYQLVPEAVVFPRNHADVVTLLRLAAEPRFRGVQLSPRGGGTGTNGQSLCGGVIVDLSRHMNRILELDLERGLVRVQPGVVLDQLNRYLKPHGVFFAPNLSPSNRATIGGMIATDACGKGSRIYGKTSNHLEALKLVFRGGADWTSRALSAGDLGRVMRQDDLVGQVHREVHAVVNQKRELIERQFPTLQRFLTGYNLAHVQPAEDAPFNLNPLIAGSEGTLAFVTEAVLRVVPIPRHKQLIAIKYADFDTALGSAQRLVAADPGAIETIDDKIIGLAREDPIWHRVSSMLDDREGAHIRAVNLVEFESDDPAVVRRKADALVAELEAELGRPGGAVGFHVTQNEQEAAALWELRKKGVGLLGNAKGARRPVPFVEDTAVPPERLAEYIRDFRALLDEANLSYGMFGHVDVGCLHVRPALNLRDEHDERLLRSISDRVVQLVKRYGGVMWSEHGKGFRSEYSPEFFGQELFADLCRIKRAFDPDNQLNPGKLAVPLDSDHRLVSVDAIKRGHYDRQIAPASLERYAVAVNCNGNGACFNYDPDDVMCPSSKVTGDRIHSPKGRASVMREWLRQLSARGYDLGAAGRAPGADAFTRIANSRRARRGEPDFSHEVFQAMDGCLSCKACATQCPVKVDVPRFKAEFLHAYYGRYARPLKDYLVGLLEHLLVVLAWWPWLNNWMMQRRLVRWLMARVVGLVDTPPLSRRSLKAELRARRAPAFDLQQLSALPEAQKQNSVCLLPDAFTTFYEPEVLLGVYDLMGELGYDVFVLPYRPNGKGLHIKGFLGAFGRLVRKNTAFLRRVAETGIPIVGVDPAVTLTYREEYAHELGEEPGFRVLLPQEWLAPRVGGALRGAAPASGAFVLLPHCTERTSLAVSQQLWQQVFAALGAQLEVPSLGCCGMCGVYGHEASHLDESRGIYEMSWGRLLQRRAGSTFLAQGHSCRSQVKRFGGFVPQHPAQALVDLLRERASTSAAPPPSGVTAAA